MATRVDTRSPAPQMDGECTVAALFFLNTQVGAQSSRAALGPVGVLCQVHCPFMGWAAALAMLTMCLCRDVHATTPKQTDLFIHPRRYKAT